MEDAAAWAIGVIHRYPAVQLILVDSAPMTTARAPKLDVFLANPEIALRIRRECHALTSRSTIDTRPIVLVPRYCLITGAVQPAYGTNPTATLGVPS